MIASPARAEDIRWRLELLKQMAIDLKDNRPLTAKELGKTTAWLAERVKTHDYSKEDAFLLREMSLSTPRV